MSNNTLSYLTKLRKSKLLDMAGETSLQEYDHLNKPDLIASLDQHLREHQQAYETNRKFEEYYRRLALPPRATPMRRSRSRDVSVDTADTAGKRRRRRGRRRTRSMSVDDSDEELEDELPRRERQNSTPSDAIHTPSNSLFPRLAIPEEFKELPEGAEESNPSFIVRRWIHDHLNDSRPLHWVENTRDNLSKPTVIQTCIVAIEAIWVVLHLLSERTFLRRDFADLVTASFWIPFSIWLTTNLLVPLTFAFFCNVRKYVVLSNRNPAYRTRSVTKLRESDLDALHFCIARALIAYIIYGNNVTVGGLLSRHWIMRVNAAAPGRWVGMVIGAAVGGVEAIYEVILRGAS